MKAAYKLTCGALLLTCLAHGQKAELVMETGHTSDVNAFAFSPDGRMLASGSQDNTIKFWNVASGRELRTLTGHKGAVFSVVFSPDGRILASVSSDMTVKLWDVASGRELRRLTSHTDSVTCAAFSPDGRLLASGSNDHTVKLWDVESGRELLTLAGHVDSVNSVAFSPDGRTLASGSLDATIKLWEVTSGRELRTLSGGLRPVLFSPDGRTLASLVTGSLHIQLWDVASGRELRTLASQAATTNSFAFSPDGRTVAGSEDNNPIKLWDVASGQELRTLAGPSFPVYAIAFSPDGHILAGSAENTIKLWDVTSGGEVRILAGHTNEVHSVAVSPDGDTLASGGVGSSITLWDLTSGSLLRTLTSHSSIVDAVAFSPDGRILASAGLGANDVNIELWDATSGRALRTLASGKDWVFSVAFSPDGRTLASAGMDANIELWDVASGRQLHVLAGHSTIVDSVVFSPDGRTLASGSRDNTIKLWSVASGSELHTLAGHTDWVYSVAFSPDGRSLASGSRDTLVKLWDVASGREMRTFSGHAGFVDSVAFSPDGFTLASATSGGVIELWDVATGQEPRILTGHTADVSSVTFTVDGHSVLSGGLDGSVRVWDGATGDQLAALYNFESGGWTVVDPQGRFDTNNLDGGAPLHWLVSDNPTHALPLEIFMRDYYTPRLLARIFNGETLPPVRPISEIRNREQPNISILSANRSKHHPGDADVIVHAASHTSEAGQASGLEQLRLFRNGQLVGSREGTLKDGDITFADIQLPKTAKSVTFTAYAFNSERIKSSTAEMQYAYEPGPPIRPRALLLQIGVNHYEASGCELNGSANDAEQLSQVLGERLTARGLDARPTVLVSIDQINDATKQKIRNALARIAAAATPDDVFFMSFSGHGYSNQKGEFYILPSDVRGSCVGVDEAMLKGAISAEELTEWLRPIDAGQMTLILDSCNSASSVESNNFKPGPMGSSGLGQLAYDKRMRILAASQPNQAARESDTLHQGLLSYALVQLGLAEGLADWNPKDNQILVGEWLSYAADAVPKFLQSGAIKAARGLTPIGEPEHQVPSAQTPAIFDFAKQDTFVLQ
ncbi:MAG TPA: caspase family protein [Terracidiphilus sp.]|jgi:WD40 repeat protein